MADIYEHTKGGLYVKLADATASSPIQEGERVVIYLSLQNGETYVRSQENFHSNVRIDDIGFGLKRFRQVHPSAVPGLVARRMKKLGLDKAYEKKGIEKMPKLKPDLVNDDPTGLMPPMRVAMLTGRQVKNKERAVLGRVLNRNKPPKTFLLNENHTTHVTKAQERKERQSYKLANDKNKADREKRRKGR